MGCHSSSNECNGVDASGMKFKHSETSFQSTVVICANCLTGSLLPRDQQGVKVAGSFAVVCFNCLSLQAEVELDCIHSYQI